MDIAIFRNLTEAQERGAWLIVCDPRGVPTDIRLKLTGPDSEVQRRARHRSIDEIRSKMGGRTKLAAEDEEKIAVDMLARSVLAWEGIEENGEPMKFTHENLCRLFSTYPWVRQQADQFASSRRPFFEEIE